MVTKFGGQILATKFGFVQDWLWSQCNESSHISFALTHWGRVTHICVNRLTITGSDNGLSPGRRQAIIWTNAGILLIRTLGTNFRVILGEIHSFSFKKMHLKMSSAKGRLFSLGLNELNHGKIWTCHGVFNSLTYRKSVSKTLISWLGWHFYEFIDFSWVYFPIIS